MWREVLIAILASLLYSNAVITNQSIAEFNVGQLFAFYDIANFCKSPVQFAIAKRNESSQCQWKIGEDLQPQRVDNKTELPIIDSNENCIFACDYSLVKSGAEYLAEKSIKRYFQQNNTASQSQYDLYTYLAPCDESIRGGNTSEQNNTHFEGYKGVYYTSDPGRCSTTDHAIENDEVLTHGAVTGLLAAKRSTAVSLEHIKAAVRDIHNHNITLEAVKEKGSWIYNAVASYFHQYPPNAS